MDTVDPGRDDDLSDYARRVLRTVLNAITEHERLAAEIQARQASVPGVPMATEVADVTVEFMRIHLMLAGHAMRNQNPAEALSAGLALGRLDATLTVSLRTLDGIVPPAPEEDT